MSSSIAAVAPPGAAHQGRRPIVAALAAGLAALGLLFSQEIAAAIHVWIDSTAYNHCFLIVPIAAFLAWERRDRFAATPLRPMPVLALGAAPIGFAWLVAERLGIMEGRQLLAMALVQLLVAAVAGWRMWRAFAAPLLYLFFLVPFGAFITPQLQDFTAHFTTAGLDVLGIPNFSDGRTIEITEGVFFVAEACAGLRFLIASVAFGALYALMMYRSPVRRLTFLAVSIVVPVVANGFRALGIVSLGHVLGSAQAAATDHVLYGWIFFSIVILALTVLGLPFRQDSAPPLVAAFSGKLMRPAAATAGLGAALAVIAVAAAAPAASLAVSMSRPHLASVPAMPVAGCTSTPLPSDLVEARAPSAVIRSEQLVCGGLPVTVRVIVFSSSAGASAVLGTRRALTQPLDAEDVSVTPLADPAGSQAWRLSEAREPFGAVADSLWLGDKPTGGGLPLRVRLARASLLNGGEAPVLIVVLPQIDWRREGEAGLAPARAAIERFLGAAPDLPDYARRLSRAAARGG